MQLPQGTPRPEGIPKRISVAVGFVLMSLATAMTLPAFIWLIGGGRERRIPCASRGYEGSPFLPCTVPAPMPLPAVVLIWLSVLFGWVSFGILLWAGTKIRRSGGRLRVITLVRFGFAFYFVEAVMVL